MPLRQSERSKWSSIVFALFLLILAFAALENSELRLFIAKQSRPGPGTLEELDVHEVGAYASFQGDLEVEQRERLKVKPPTSLQHFSASSLHTEFTNAQASYRASHYGLFAIDKGPASIEFKDSENRFFGASFGFFLPENSPSDLCLQLIGQSDALQICVQKDGSIAVSQDGRVQSTDTKFKLGQHAQLGVRIHKSSLESDVINLDLIMFQNLAEKNVYRWRGPAPERVVFKWQEGSEFGIHGVSLFHRPPKDLTMQMCLDRARATQNLIMPWVVPAVMILISLLTLLNIFSSRYVRPALSIATASGATILMAFFAVSVFAPSAYMVRDSGKFHFDYFVKLSKYLRETGQFPTWIYGQDGGFWTAVTSNNFILLAPHKVFSLVTAAVLPIDLNLIFKTSLLFGILGVFFTYWRLVQKTVEEFELRFAVLGIFFFFSAPFISTWHQEQALGTIAWLPIICLSWLEFRRKPQVVSAALLGAAYGMGLNLHYPHLLVIATLCAIVAEGIRRAVLRESLGWSQRFRVFKKTNIVYFLVFSVCLLLASSPLLYSYLNYFSQLESPFRSQSQIGAKTFLDYLNIHLSVRSSVHPLYLLSYLLPDWNLFGFGRDLWAARVGFWMAELDENNLRISQIVFPAILMACVFCQGFFRKNLFGLLFFSLLVLSTLGLFGPLIAVYFFLIPGIGVFRQWVHFLPIANLVLGVIFLRAIAALLNSSQLNCRLPTQVMVAIGVVTFLIGGVWSALAVLVVAWFIRTRTIDRGARVLVLIGFMLLCNANWFVQQMGRITVQNQPLFMQVSMLDANRYFAELLMQRAGYFQQDLVKIRDFSPAERRIEAVPTETVFKDGRLQFSLKEANNGFVFSQFNDGQWLATGNHRILQNGKIFFEGPGLFTIGRKSDVWIWWVCISVSVFSGLLLYFVIFRRFLSF